MNRRDLFKFLGCLPFAAQLLNTKPVPEAQVVAQKPSKVSGKKPEVVCLGEAPFTVPPNRSVYFDHIETTTTGCDSSITVWGYYL